MTGYYLVYAAGLLVGWTANQYRRKALWWVKWSWHRVRGHHS